MRKEFSAFTLAVGLGVVMLLGCGGSSMAPSSSTTSTPTGSLAVLGSDAPLCDVISFQVTITGATLTPQGGGTPVSIFSSDESVPVDFARLIDFASLLKLKKVRIGTYSQITLSLADPHLTVLNIQTSPPTPLDVPATLTTSTATANIVPALTISENGVAGLGIDFAMRKAVQTDANGQVTGMVAPEFRAFPANGEAERFVDELHGVVGTVTNTSSNTAYTGSFTLQTRGGSGPALTIYVTNRTDFDGIANLNALSSGAFVEVDVNVDGSGNLVAKEVEAHEQVAASQMRAAFLGKVLAVQRDAAGNATQIKLFVREEFPDMSTAVPMRSALTVNLSPITIYRIGALGMNEANLTFNASTLGLGEAVGVIGILQPGAPPELNARGVVLRRQAVLGNYTSLLAAGSDGKTGGFTMVPCGAVFQGNPMTVLTFADTVFDNVSGLVALGPKPTLAVKGILLYEQMSGSVNSAAWTAPTWVMQARRVHQLPQ